MQVCVVGSPGNTGPLYAPLIGSKWELSMYSPTVLTKPYPIDTFSLKVKVKYCSASSSSARKDPAIAPKFKRELRVSSECCSTRNMVFNQILNLKQGGLDPCYTCSATSVPRLDGFYCESCPAGYEPSGGSFGCKPCGVAYFKVLLISFLIT